MTAYQLHQDGDCWPDTCPVCAQEDADEPTVVELLESATGRNGETLLANLREFGMDVVRLEDEA